MGFILEVEGLESLQYGETIVQSVESMLRSPADSRARSTNDSATLRIAGKLHGDGEENSETIKLFEWAQVPAEKDDAYRSVTVKINAFGECFRQITFPKAFVVDYAEHYDTGQGIGEFVLIVRQKADKVSEVAVAGGIPLPEEAPETDESSEARPEKPTAAMPALQKPANSSGIGVSDGGFAPDRSEQTQMLKNIGRAAVTAAAQNAIRKADPSGTASAVAGALETGLQNGGDTLRSAGAATSAAVRQEVARKIEAGSAFQEALRTMKVAENVSDQTQGMRSPNMMGSMIKDF